MRISDHHCRQGGRCRLHFLLPLAVILFASSLPAQDDDTSSVLPALPEFPAPVAIDLKISSDQQNPPNPQPPRSGPSDPTDEQRRPAEKPGETGTPPANPQPQRILGIMPNFRAVSAGVMPPPPTPKEAFIIATKNSFDYSSFIFVGITSLLAEATNTHGNSGKGVPGFGRYYWRGLTDKTDGNYLVIFALAHRFSSGRTLLRHGQRQHLEANRLFCLARRSLLLTIRGTRASMLQNCWAGASPKVSRWRITPARLGPLVGSPASLDLPSGGTPSPMPFANSGPTSPPTSCTAIRNLRSSQISWRLWASARICSTTWSARRAWNRFPRRRRQA